MGCTVHVTSPARHLPKIKFTGLRARRCKEESSNFVKRQTPYARVRAFCGEGGVCMAHRAPARGTERISGDPHIVEVPSLWIPCGVYKEESYYRTA